jgi:hypothetical protein
MEDLSLTFQNAMISFVRMIEHRQESVNRRVLATEQRLTDSVCVLAWVSEESRKHASSAREVDRLRKQVAEINAQANVCAKRLQDLTDSDAWTKHMKPWVHDVEKTK